MSDYKGYKLLDKIILVERDMGETVHNSHDYPQAYLVDPYSKTQLGSAKRWATWTEYVRDDQFQVTGTIEHGPTVHEFENSGFKISFLESASESSQGGKLSFWNCLVEKDDKKFCIGINSDMLLDVIKESTFVNGVCQERVCCATKKSNCGVVVEGGEAFKDALKDMIHKDKMKKKTVKYNPGDQLLTVSSTEWYLGEAYVLYEFKTVYQKTGWGYNGNLDTFKTKLVRYKEPKKVHLFVNKPWGLKEGEEIPYTVGAFFDKRAWFETRDKKPARTLGSQPLKEDTMTYADGIKRYYEMNSVFKKNHYGTSSSYHNYTEFNRLQFMLNSRSFGIGPLDAELDEDVVKILTENGIKIVDE